MLAAIIATLALIGGQAGSADATGCHGSCKRHHRSAPTLFAGSFWTTLLSDDAPISPQSAALVQRLRSSVSQYGAGIDTTHWSTPVYTVPGNQPRVTVKLDKPPGIHEALRRALRSVPIPADAQPSDDADAHMVVLQPSTDSMWEFWGARRVADGWHTRFGGVMTDVSHDRGYFPSYPGWGATATGLPLLGGLMRISELQSGRIDHALSLAIPNARAGVYAWPAQRTDGSDLSPQAIPEGTRFRLPASLDLSQLAMPPLVRQMARAAKRYGIVVTDGAAAVTFYAEDPAPLGVNPYFRLFGGSYPSQLLQSFPWSRLRALGAKLQVHP